MFKRILAAWQMVVRWWQGDRRGENDQFGHLVEHTFPNGLHVTVESDIAETFVKERNAISTQDELDAFQRRWGDICVEMAEPVAVEEFLAVRDDRKKQIAATQNPTKSRLLHLLLPFTLLQVSRMARYFEAPTGCALIQMLNSGYFLLDEHGRLRVTASVSAA